MINYYENKCNRCINKCKNLVLSSGGLLGFSYLGFHKYIDELCLENQFKNILGVSAGSVYGSLLAIGYNYLEIRNIILNLEVKEYVDIKVDNILEILQKKGLMTTDKIIIFIKKLIENKTHDGNITFKQVYDKYDKNILIGTTNLTTHRFEVFCKENYPDLPIIKAIELSICIPIIFNPIVFNNCVYVDGAVIDSFPIQFFDINSTTKYNYSNEIINEYMSETSIDETLGILLSNTRDYVYPDYLESMKVFDYINASITLLIAKNEEMLLKYSNNTVIFEVPKQILVGLDLNNISIENLKNLINISYNVIFKNVKYILIDKDNNKDKDKDKAKDKPNNNQNDNDVKNKNKNNDDNKENNDVNK